MLQRNDTDYPLIVGTDPAVLVEPGGTCEHEHPVMGLTPVAASPPSPAASNAQKLIPPADEEAAQ